MPNTTEQRGFWLSCAGQRLIEELPVHHAIQPPFTKVLVTGVQGESFQFTISKDAFPYGAHVYFRGRAKTQWIYFFDAIPDFAYLHRHRDPAVTQHADPFWECWFPKWIFGQTNLVWAVVVPLSSRGAYDGFGQQVAFVLKSQPRHWQVANADELLIQRLMEITLGPKEEEEDMTETAQAATPPPDSTSSPTIAQNHTFPQTAATSQPQPDPSFDPFAAARKATESRRFDTSPHPSLPSSSRSPARQVDATRAASQPQPRIQHQSILQRQHSIPTIAEAIRPNVEAHRDIKPITAPSTPAEPRAPARRQSPIRIQTPVPESLPPGTQTPARTQDRVRTPTPQLPSPVQVQIAARAQRETQTSTRSRSNIRARDQVDSDYSDDDTPFSELLRPLTALEVSAIGLATLEASPGPRKSKRIQQLRRRTSYSAEAETYRFVPIRPTDRGEDIERLKSFWHLPVTANPELRFLLTVEPDPHDTSDADSTPLRELQSEEENNEEGDRDNPKYLVQVEDVPDWIRQIAGDDVSVRRQDLACPVKDVSSEETPDSTPTPGHSTSPRPGPRKVWDGIPCQKYNHIGLLDPVLNQRYEIRMSKAAKKAKEDKAEANKAKAKAKRARDRRRQLRR